jgi:GT2 family glycosyltransferase
LLGKSDARQQKPVPMISVIIPTFNDSETIEMCLKTLSEQQYPHFEVIIVNDGSTDHSLEKIKKAIKSYNKIDFRLISFRFKRGVSLARNAAIKEARGKIFVFSDGDCYFEKNWLEQLIEPLQDPVNGCCGGPDQVPLDSTPKTKCIDYSMHSLFASGRIRRGTMNLAKYAPSGCNMAVRRDVIERVGDFNPFLKIRGEEKELVHRIRQAGYAVVYVEWAWVWHHRRPTIKSFFIQTYRSGKARIDILRLYPDALEFAHLFPALITAGLLIGGILSFFNPMLRKIWLMACAVYLVLLFVDALNGALKLRMFRALAIIPITSAVIHFGYGIGSIIRCFCR